MNAGHKPARFVVCVKAYCTAFIPEANLYSPKHCSVWESLLQHSLRAGWQFPMLGVYIVHRKQVKICCEKVK